MMRKTTKLRMSRVLVAGAVALLSQGAWSDDGNIAASASTTVGIQLPRPQMAPVHAKIASEVKAHVEALNRRLAEDLARALEETLDASRIELAIAEVPTRG